MTLHGTPNDLIQNLDPIAIIIMVPLADFVFYPLLRRWRIKFSPIKRIYAGFIVAGFGRFTKYFSALPTLISTELESDGLRGRFGALYISRFALSR